ncbi:MAG: phospholipase D/transphosphatidylase, partial [Caulobacteraceae bacterium]|nr:phospholipase D/transphosphatidylase [Caulobacteraceae bacterium]
LNNRSGGFDTECELAVESDDPTVRRNIEAFRDRLVGHFMGFTGEAVAKVRSERGGLVAAIDHLNREGRLVDIEPPGMTGFGEAVAVFHLGDPSDVSDSWLPWRRRERLFREAREMALVAHTPPPIR